MTSSHEELELKEQEQSRQFNLLFDRQNIKNNKILHPKNEN